MLRKLPLAQALPAILLAFGMVLAVSPGLSPAASAAEEPASTAEAGLHEGTAEAGNEESPNILELQPPLAISTVVVFLVLLAVLWRFAWGPLSKALHDREHHHEETLRLAEHSRAEAERLLAENRQQMDQAEERVRAMLEQARHDAQATGEDIVKRAQAEAEAARERAERDIATARDQALLEIWSKTADLAVQVAGKVLSRQMDEGDHRRLIEAAVSELPAAPTGHEGQHA